MLNKLLEALKLSRNGKLDVDRILVLAAVLGAFVLWRAFSFGIYGSDRVMAEIKAELIGSYTQALYKRYGLYDDTTTDKKQSGKVTDERFPHEEIEDLDVAFSNVSISSSLLTGDDFVIVRFDYVLKASGIAKESERGVYKRVSRNIGAVIYDSDPFSYYINYL